MDCKCRFDLFSMKLSIFSLSYDIEKYEMSCSEAARFLKQLDPAFHADKYPLHKIKYQVTDDKHTYISELTETPAKAAAKIKLFMKNPNWLLNLK